MPENARRWKASLADSDKPAYLALADAIAEDIRSGRLSAHDRLPPLRTLARELACHYTTAARGYAEARARGLIDARAGHGSFVHPSSAAASARSARTVGLVEMTMNLPPEPALTEPALAARIQKGVLWLAEQGQPLELLRYQDFGGAPPARDAGARWLAGVVPGLDDARVLVVPGIQAALSALFSTLVRPGEVLCSEAITYPGVKGLAAQFGIRLHGLPMDAQGVVPQEFETACRVHRPRALYLNPTLQNPTTRTVTPARRQVLVAIARQYGVLILEDDAYGLLPEHAPATFARLAPELTYYVGGLSKHLGAGLRVAYLVAPDAAASRRLASALRATTIMASPFTVALATRFINDGTADLMLKAIRAESRARQRLAADYLPRARSECHADGFHLWLTLPAPWHRVEFATRLTAAGIGAVGADAFTVAGPPPAAVRLCLGGPGDRAACRANLERVARMLQEEPVTGRGA